MLIMGSMIGSGIFIVSAQIARDVNSIFYLMLAWIVTAVLTILAALSYGELAAMMPKAGGQYVYLKEAYGKLFGFLYGWTLFTVIQTGTIAAVAVAFAKFAGVIFPSVSEKNILLQIGEFKIHAAQLVGILVIWVLTCSNFRNVKSGALVQNIFTFSKIIALLFVIAAGVYYIFTNDFLIQTSNQLISQSTNQTQNLTLGIFCAALVGSIFSADAWNNITFTAGEVEKPERNLPLSLLLGTGAVLVLYIVINLIYTNALSLEEIKTADSDRVGTLLLQKVFGVRGADLMAIFIMISTFGCVNGLTLSGARVYYAMAKDKLFLSTAASLNKNNSPEKALIMQGVWASVLALSGSYGDLLDYVVFAVLLFYILTVAGVFVLRIKQPDAIRPYKVFAYPILPAIYIIMATVISVSLLIYKPNYTYPGLAIVLAGIPVYFLLNRKN